MREIINDIKTIREQYGEQKFIENFDMFSGYCFKVSEKPITIDDIFIVNNDTKNNDTYKKQYEWFNMRQYYNVLLNNDTNKSVGHDGIGHVNKKIHSVTPYSLLFKYEQLSDEIDKSGISAYENLKKYIKSYIAVLNYYNNGILDEEKYTDFFLGKVEEIKLILESDLTDIALTSSDRIYIYMSEDMGININHYREAYYNYLKMRIILDKNAFIMIGEEKYGVSSFSMSLNADKPSLKMVDTLRDYPNYISFEEAEILNLISKLNIKIPQIIYECLGKQYVLRFNKKGLERYEKINFKESKSVWEEFYILRDNSLSSEVFMKSREEIVDVIDREFTKGLLYKLLTLNDDDCTKTLISGNKKINEFVKKYSDTIGFTPIDEKYLQNLNIYRGLYYEYFIKNTNVNVVKSIESLLQSLFESFYKNGLKFDYLKERFDTIINIMNYIVKEDGGYSSMAKNIFKIKNTIEMNRKENKVCITSDEEFFFYCGQYLQFLATLSEARDRNYRSMVRFNDLKSIRKLKDELIYRFTKYSYKLPMDAEAYINCVYQAIMEYKLEDDEVINIRKSKFWYYYHAGLVGSNVLLGKNKENELVEVV